LAFAFDSSSLPETQSIEPSTVGNRAGVREPSKACVVVWLPPHVTLQLFLFVFVVAAANKLREGSVQRPEHTRATPNV
jgi:hypothetical protein